MADELTYNESINASNNLRSKVDSLILSIESFNVAIKESFTTPDPSEDRAFLT